MSSQIDETLPVFGQPQTASVRANFATAKAEISALQVQTGAAPFLSLAGGTMTGPMYLYNDPTDVMMPATKGYVDAHAGSGDGGGGISEAPADTNTYGRHAGAWLPVLPMTGGTLTGILTLSGPPVGGLDAATKAYVDAAPNRAITISGDATGSGAAAIPLTLATVFSTPGTFQGLRIDGKGRITAAANMNYAPLTNPAFAGIPTGPTAAPGTNTTQLATCAFVKNQGYATGGPYLPTLGGNITGALSVAGTLTVGATLTSSASGGAFTISATPTITGNITFQGGLYSGASGGVFTISGTPTITGTLSTAAINMGGTLTCSQTILSTGGRLMAQCPESQAYPSVTVFSTDTGYAWCMYGITQLLKWGRSDATGSAINELMRLDDTGNVIIQGTLTQVSDRRLKRDIAPWAPGLAAICALRPSSYRRTGLLEVGLIADEVEAFIPDAVREHTDFDGHPAKCLALMPLISALVNAVRELAGEVADLREAKP